MEPVVQWILTLEQKTFFVEGYDLICDREYACYWTADIFQEYNDAHVTKPGLPFSGLQDAIRSNRYGVLISAVHFVNHADYIYAKLRFT